MGASQKKCAKCGAVKPLDAFHKDPRMASGRRSYCKECARATHQKWYAANPGKYREHQRKQYAANPEKHRESVRRWREANPEKKRESGRKWYKANTEKAYKKSRIAVRKLMGTNYANLRELFGPACSDCGWELPTQIFEYHHTDPATKNGALSMHWGWKRVKAYVEHGTVQLCPTCHRLRHFAEPSWGRRQKPTNTTVILEGEEV